MCVISLIVFTDQYQGHVWTFYTNGFSLYSNYIQIHKHKDSSWEYLKTRKKSFSSSSSSKERVDMGILSYPLQGVDHKLADLSITL